MLAAGGNPTFLQCPNDGAAEPGHLFRLLAECTIAYHLVGRGRVHVEHWGVIERNADRGEL